MQVARNLLRWAWIIYGHLNTARIFCNKFISLIINIIKYINEAFAGQDHAAQAHGAFDEKTDTNDVYYVYLNAGTSSIYPTSNNKLDIK